MKKSEPTPKAMLGILLTASAVVALLLIVVMVIGSRFAYAPVVRELGRVGMDQEALQGSLRESVYMKGWDGILMRARFSFSSPEQIRSVVAPLEVLDCLEERNFDQDHHLLFFDSIEDTPSTYPVKFSVGFIEGNLLWFAPQIKRSGFSREYEDLSRKIYIEVYANEESGELFIRYAREY